MSNHLFPVSPALSVEVLDVGGHAAHALLIAIRWDEQLDETRALVASPHDGLSWVEHARIEAAHLPLAHIPPTP